MDPIVYIFIAVVIAALFFGLAAYGLSWAVKTGQFENLNKASRVIFTEEEPEGQQQDSFPGKAKADKK